MRRHELSDAQWKIIEPLLPRNEGRGRPWRDHRTVINGIFWILHTGAAWRDLPERYGAWQTAYDRYKYWQRDGTWERILKTLQVRTSDDGGIDWELFGIDSTVLRGGTPAVVGRKKTLR